LRADVKNLGTEKFGAPGRRRTPFFDVFRMGGYV
jgi:hypothetical protein